VRKVWKTQSDPTVEPTAKARSAGRCDPWSNVRMAGAYAGAAPISSGVENQFGLWGPRCQPFSYSAAVGLPHVLETSDEGARNTPILVSHNGHVIHIAEPSHLAWWAALARQHH
jgi:hypothetical protein